MSPLFFPYNLAGEIDKHFAATSQGALDDDDFFNLIETLQATGSEKNQKETAKLFKTLSKDEVIRRSAIVSRLDKLLTTIKTNRINVIQNTSLQTRR